MKKMMTTQTNWSFTVYSLFHHPMSDPFVFILVIVVIFFIAWLLVQFLDLCENSNIISLGPGFMLTFPMVIKLQPIVNERSPLRNDVVQVWKKNIQVLLVYWICKLAMELNTNEIMNVMSHWNIRVRETFDHSCFTYNFSSQTFFFKWLCKLFIRNIQF